MQGQASPAPRCARAQPQAAQRGVPCHARRKAQRRARARGQVGHARLQGVHEPALLKHEALQVLGDVLRVQRVRLRARSAHPALGAQHRVLQAGALARSAGSARSSAQCGGAAVPQAPRQQLAPRRCRCAALRCSQGALQGAVG